MEKTIFNSQAFHGLVIAALGILLCWNLYIYLNSKNLIVLIPTIVQIIILVLVLTKNKHAKLGIKIWAIILIAGPSLSILGNHIVLFLGKPTGAENPIYNDLINNEVIDEGGILKVRQNAEEMDIEDRVEKLVECINSILKGN